MMRVCISTINDRYVRIPRHAQPPTLRPNALRNLPWHSTISLTGLHVGRRCFITELTKVLHHLAHEDALGRAAEPQGQGAVLVVVGGVSAEGGTLAFVVLPPRGMAVW